MENVTILNPVNQITKMPALKDSYNFASTESILDTLSKHGWTASSQMIARARAEHRKGFQRHIVRLQNPAFPTIPGLARTNESRPEIIILNSHDGTTRLRMLLGLIRMVCLNGVIAGTGLRQFSAVHTGSLTEKLEEGVQYMTDGIPKLFDAVQSLQNRTFSQEARLELIDTLARERLKHINVVRFDAGTVDAVRRQDDASTDAFTVFNRIQETLVRGGIQFVAKKNILDAAGNVIGETLRHGTTRRLSSIPQTVKLNTLAFETALKLAA